LPLESLLKSLLSSIGPTTCVLAGSIQVLPSEACCQKSLTERSGVAVAVPAYALPSSTPRTKSCVMPEPSL
jgi:hypothetical protein